MKKHIDIDMEDFWITFFKFAIIIFCVAESFYIPTVIILKLCHVIDWPWYIVLIPLEADFAMGAIGVIVFGIWWIVDYIVGNFR